MLLQMKQCESSIWGSEIEVSVLIKLNRIVLEGFKSIRHMDFDLRPLNVFIGPNGAGKSNFLALFSLLNYMTTNGLQLHVGKLGGANAFLYYGVKQTKQIHCELYFETEAGQNYYQMRLVNAARDTLLFADEKIAFTKKGSIKPMSPVSLGAGHRETMLGENLQTLTLNKTANVICDLMKQWKFYQFHDTSAEANIKTKTYIGDNRYLRSDAGNLAAFLFRLANQEPKYYKRIVATIQQIAPFFDDFLLRPTIERDDYILLEWKEKNSDLVFSANQLSDGTLRMMALVTLLLQPQLPSLICIDEPELGLHPYAIKVLASLLKMASMKSQIIVSTQSVTLVDALEPEDLVVVNRKEGQTVFERLDQEKLAQWLSEYSLGELWEKNVIGGRPSW